MTDDTEAQRLIAVANSDGQARAELAGGVDRPHYGQAARAALARSDAPSPRAALDASTSALGNRGAQ